MATKSGGFNKKELKEIIGSMEQTLNPIKGYMEKYENNINTIEYGANSDGGKGLWSGDLAVKWVKNAKKDCAILAELYNQLVKCHNCLEVLYNQGKGK